MERQTKAQKKDEAKKRRLEEMRRRQRRSRMRKIYTLVVIVVIVAIVAGLAAIASAHNAIVRHDAATLAKSAGCEPPMQFPSEGRNHVNFQAVKYKTDPPTSGAHWITDPSQKNSPQAPTSTGIHATPIQDEIEVHNLEHGHVIIQYRPGEVSNAILTKLADLVKKNSSWMILAPRDNKNTTLALTAWTIKQRCDTPNMNVVKVAQEFYKRFHNQGPESIPGTPVYEEIPGVSAASQAPQTSVPQQQPSQ